MHHFAITTHSLSVDPHMFGKAQVLEITEDTEDVARYLQDKFQNLRVGGDGKDIQSPTKWSLEYFIEADLAANIIWKAFQNQSEFCTFSPCN